MTTQIGQQTIQDPTSNQIASALLRRERMVTEMYQRVINKFHLTDPVSTLQDLKFEHQKSVAGLSRLLERQGIQTTTASTGLSEIRRHLSKAKALSGQHSALSALIEGENFLRNTYRTLLSKNAIDENLRELISHSLLPRAIENRSSLLLGNTREVSSQEAVSTTQFSA